VSEYSFGGFEADDMSGLGEATDQQSQQGPKWFREGLAKLSSQVNELKAENDRLKAQQKQQAVADALKAKGYAPQAAGLFQGEPEKLDEWLSANGAALAKLPGDGQEQGEQQTHQGPPPTTVPADGQEQLRLMQEQGTQGVAPPQGTDNEIAAALKAADPENFVKLMQSQGSPFDWSNFSNPS
jgi:ABC-type transporter Mla subunit MlaD